MPRPRSEITLDRVKTEGEKNFVYLKHPVLKRTIAFALGTDAERAENLRCLNAIYLNEDNWRKCPKGTPPRMWQQWDPGSVIKLHPGGKAATKGDKPLGTTAKEVATLRAELEGALQREAILLRRIEQQARELEALRGKKYAKKDSPALADAKAKWIVAWSGRKDAEYAKTVSWDLDKFVEKFKPDTKVDAMEGRETEINTWLQTMQTPAARDDNGKVIKWKPISPSRLMQIRVYVLKMLTESGARLDRSKIVRPSKKEMKQKRGAIKWLERDDAKKILKHLPGMFADAFRIQCAVGLRPDELLTLHRSNFKNDFAKLELSPVDGLTLKTGGRIIPIPEDLRPMLKFRALQCEYLFPEPAGKTPKKGRKDQYKNLPPAAGGKPWRDPKMFSRRFKAALSAAAKAAGINMPMDSRIGRRSCASWLLQDNIGADKIAALLGNSAAMIIDHYGDPDIEKMDLRSNTLADGRKTAGA